MAARRGTAAGKQVAKPLRARQPGARGGTAKPVKPLNLGKMAGAVSGDFGRGVAALNKGLDRAIPLASRTSKTVPSAMANAPKARAALKKSLGR